MIVRNLFLCLLLINLSTPAQAQQGAEFGGFIGGSHYFGDLNTIPIILLKEEEILIFDRLFQIFLHR